MISALSWIPRGVAKALPSSEELERDSEGMAIEGRGMEEEEEEEEDDDEEDEDEDDQSDNESMEEEEEESDPVEKARAMAAVIQKDKKKNSKQLSKGRKSDADDELAELDMENYEDEADAGELRLFGNGGLGAAYYKIGEADPLLQGEDEEDEEDIDDLTIRLTDLLLVVARNEDDVSHLEVWVCEEAGNQEDELNMYVHHDVMLPAFPLSLAWVGCDIKSPSASEKGNLVAVGAMQPAIEIWDLDEIERVEPVAILGGAQTLQEAVPEGKSTKKGILNLKTKKKKKKEINLVEGSHSDAVLGLAWNMEKRNLLASGSADCSVKVWDITTRQCETTFTHHTDKVQAVAWRPRDASALLSGSFDRTAALVDVRSPSSAVLQWSLTADVECLAWDPHTGFSFVVSTEDGLVKCHDVRMGGRDSGTAPLYTLHAHDKATCAVSFNHSIPNMLATASTDKMVKLWDTTDNKPTCIASTNPKVGAIFSLGFSGDSPFLLAMGGSKGELHIWDTLKNSAMSQRYGSSQVAA